MISCSLTTGFVYLSGTALGAAVLGGGYLTVRDTHPRISVDTPLTTAGADASEQLDDEMPGRHATDSSSESMDTDRSSVLEILPQDEQRVVEPVLTSPGITQQALRDRADFSKAKISQTVTDLEKRGLLYREPYGRTYRVYPDESLPGASEHRSNSE